MDKNLNNVVEFVEIKKCKLKGFTLIEGFPDIGLAGTIGTRYLIEKLNFEQIGHVDSRLLSPIIRIQNGLPMHPVRLYAHKKHKIVIIIAEQIIPNSIASVMAKTLVEWVKKKGINRVISTSGIRIADGAPVYAFASNEKSKKLIKKYKLELIDSGISSGVTALLMLYLTDNNIESFCLMGNARNNADYESAAEIVKAFCNLSGIKLVDVTPLLEEAKKLEASIVQHIKELESKKQDSEIQKIDTPMYT